MPYVVITLTLNGQPTPRLLPGWLAVLTQDDPTGGNRVRLGVSPVQPGAPGAHPDLIYTVAACGSHDFTGELLMAGEARLTSTDGKAPTIITSDTTGGPATSPAIHRDQSLSIYDAMANSDLRLSNVDVVDIRFQDLPSCVSQINAGSKPQATFLGRGLAVEGKARGPIQHTWRIGPFVAPRTTSSWPLVGTMSGIAFNDFGEFQATGALLGRYRIPTPLDVQIHSGQLTSLAQVEESRPTPVDGSSLDWAAFGPIEPTTRVANTDDISSWQAWQIVAAILIGVAGSLLAAVALDSMRSWSRHASRHSGSEQIAVTPTATPPSSLGKALVIALVLLLMKRGVRNRAGLSS